MNDKQLLVNYVGGEGGPRIFWMPVITLDICMWTDVVDSFCVFKQYQYTGMLAHTWNLGSQEVNRGGPKVRGQQEFHLRLQKVK